jgi:hypothetical protein
LTVRQFIRSSALLLSCFSARRSVAQATTNPQVDASVLPRGIGDARVLSAWTRYDELFGTAPGLTGFPRNIAYSLNTDSLTSVRAPSLAPTETAIRTLAADPTFRLTAGNLVAAANSRVVTAPLILEYGLLKHLTIDAVVPLVETRSTVFQQPNPKLGAANVGPNPSLTNSQLRGSEATLVSSFRSAAAALTQQLAQCQATPTPGCAPLLAQLAAVQTLIQTTGSTATAIETLYGGDDAHPGQAFVPLASSPIQAAIQARIVGLIAQYQSLLPTVSITGTVAGAGGPGARIDMQQLLASVGRDSLASVSRTSIGDVSVGATLQLFNTFRDTMVGRQARLAVHGEFRFGTGEPAERNKFFDVPTGYGQPGVELGAASDMTFNRHVSATVLASYTAQLGTINVARVPAPANFLLPLTDPVPGTYSAGNVASISVIPRWRLAGYFVIDGQYTLTNIGADQYVPVTTVASNAPLGNAAATTQALGFGFSYATTGISNPAPRRLPYEVSFSHLETLTGTGGPIPKAFRDQVMLRVYFGR